MTQNDNIVYRIIRGLVPNPHTVSGVGYRDNCEEFVMDKKQKGIFLYSIFLVLIIGVETSFKSDWASAALSGAVLILLVTIYLELDGKGL